MQQSNSRYTQNAVGKLEDDKVITKKDSIVRCGWCGTYYLPEEMQPMPDGSRFCSIECMRASMSVRFKSDLIQSNVTIFCSGSIMILSILLIAAIPSAIPIWFAGLYFSFCCLFIATGMRRLNKEAREYYYRKDMHRDSFEVLLECDFCSHLNPPNALDCQHCDGSLKGSLKVEGEVPAWLKTEVLQSQNQKKCTHCGAIYGYVAPAEDGTLTCHNCGKKFPF
jgi:hypothetical protein